MKKFDFVFDFGKPEPFKIGGVCWIRTYETQNKGLVTFITDLKENNGTSVTNAIEIIIEKLISERGFENHTFIEHYEKNGTFSNQDNFDKVFIKNSKPHWETLGTKEIEELIGTNNFTDLISDKSSTNTEIQKKVKEITESEKLIFISSKNDNLEERKLNIKKKMKSKKELINLIEKGAIEQELLNFFKQDLSFFGEVYAKPEDEYIVFSEFLIEKGSEDKDGKIDFVLFTGRSRMDVIFIEIKGANFYMFNKNGYEQPHADISKAKKQILDRLEVTYYNNRSVFRKKCHDLRSKAENEESKYNYLIGAKGKLEVDPDKEIKIQTVIIGGRTRIENDKRESLERDKIERSYKVPLKLETWDSWIKKLKRNN